MNRENEAWKSIYGTTGGEFDERSSDALVLRAIQESRGEKTNEAVRVNNTSSWVETMQNGGRPVSRPEDRPHIRQASENAGSPLRQPVRKPQSIATESTPNVTNDLSDPLAQVTFRNGERTGEYLGSNEGNEELITERDYDRLSAAYDRLVREGRMTEEEAYRRKEIAFNSAIGMIEKSRQDYLNRINGRLPQQANGEVDDDDYDDDLDDDELDDSSDEEEDEIGEIRLELDALEKDFDNQKENRIREIEKMFNGDDDHKGRKRNHHQGLIGNARQDSLIMQENKGHTKHQKEDGQERTHNNKHCGLARRHPCMAQKHQLGHSPARCPRR